MMVWNYIVVVTYENIKETFPKLVNLNSRSCLTVISHSCFAFLSFTNKFFTTWPFRGVNDQLKP